MDSPFSNFYFAQMNGVTFPLLGDWGGEVTRKYGLEKTIEIQGAKMATGRRATFLIDKTGKIIETQADNEAVDPAKVVAACERVKKG